MAECTASMRSRMACSAVSSRDVTATGRPAQIRVIISVATSPSRAGSVPRTSPYLAARTRAGSAAIRWVTSVSSAARSLTAASTAGRASPRSASRHRSVSAVSSSSAVAPAAIGPGPLRGGRRDRAAPHARLDQGQVELGPPGQLPALPERPDVPGPGLLRRAPGHLEQGEPVQQAAAGQVVRLAQVQVVVPGRGLGPQPQVTLLVLQVPLQRHHRGGGRHRAEPLADHQPPLDERDEQLAALAEHRAGGLGDLLQAGQRPSAQRGERLGEPDGLDDVRRRRRDALVAQDGGGLGQPPLDRLARGGEQVVIPAGGADARPVARGVGQPPVGPRHPGQGGLHPRQAAQQPVVGGR